MGWVFSHREKGQSHLDFFRQEFDSTNAETGVSFRLLDIAARGTTLYAAMEIKPPRGEIEVTAIVILTRWNRHGRFNFGYKDISEDMGPYACDCPARILDLLTPTDNEQANEWRERARARRTYVPAGRSIYHRVLPDHRVRRGPVGNRPRT